MRFSSFAPVALLAGLSNALPQGPSSGCVTVTTEVIVPTGTYTYSTTDVTITTASGPKDLGTFTLVTRESSTTTLETLTTIATDCTASGTVTAPATRFVYTSAGEAAPSYGKRDIFGRDDACTVTVGSTTTVGETETLVPNGKTSTYTAYTAYIQATTTITQYGGTAYAIATATATTSALCGPTVNSTTSTTTVTRDARCAPTALVSEYDGFGLEYTNGPTLGGAVYETTADSASECCQLCIEANSCAASTWDIRNNLCSLAFATDYDTGKLECGARTAQGFLVFYDAGPPMPMAPGTGLFVGLGCGYVQYTIASPNDGT